MNEKKKKYYNTLYVWVVKIEHNLKSNLFFAGLWTTVLSDGNKNERKDEKVESTVKDFIVHFYAVHTSWKKKIDGVQSF